MSDHKARFNADICAALTNLTTALNAAYRMEPTNQSDRILKYVSEHKAQVVDAKSLSIVLKDAAPGSLRTILSKLATAGALRSVGGGMYISAP